MRNTNFGNRNQSSRGNQENPTDAYRKFYSNDLMEKILVFKSSPSNEVVDKIKGFMNEYSKDISTHQLRNIFQEIKRSKLIELPLKRPKLVYVAARSEKSNIGLKALTLLIDDLIVKINDDSKLDSVKMFLEANVAYHKYFSEQSKN
jgi:CRISPR type III-A-associated protein Csm2